MRRIFLLAFLAPVAAWAFGSDPFEPEVRLDETGAPPMVRVSFHVPPQHILYADELKISADNAQLVAVDPPPPESILDHFTGEQKDVFNADVRFVFNVADPKPDTLKLTVRYQGCDDKVCFFPQKKNYSFPLAVRPAAAEVPLADSNRLAPATIGKTTEKNSNDWNFLVSRFAEPKTAAGYLNKQQFLDFLGGGADSTLADFEKRGLLLTMLLLLLGGVALNLTPCVLPLIPINLAILGAGSQARTKGQGFILGGLYGLAMALVYGALGILVVFTGAKFGALNASLWFNVGIAILFVVLALAMFDVIAIDFSRFQGTANTQGRTGAAQYTTAFILGGVAALLAGACVAPVVISTLLLSGNLYAAGNKAAALLPFLLGLGMGLPWPFAGAGLSFLPKPGKWMTWIKYVFGVLILALAFYYGKIGWDIYRLQSAKISGDGDPAVASTMRLTEALQQQTKPVFIDLWATWCKNCHAMEATTFRDAEVRQRLQEYIVVKYQAEFPDQSPAKDVLDHFHAIGLPTYVVLEPLATPP